jgi:two-component system response regulator DesR
MPLIRTLLVEDMTLVRGGLVALLEKEKDIEVVADVGRGDQVLPAALKARPDVAVIGIDLPDSNGHSVAGELRAHLPACRAVLLTSLKRAGTLRSLVADPTLGFLVTEAPPDRLAECVRRAARGERVLDPDLAARLLWTADSPLNQRELEILRIAADGASTREIASRLSLATGTVRNYLSTAVGKIGARNRIDAVRIARDAGWL